MLEYRFEEVDARRDPRLYREVASERALEGWRLVQVLVETPAAMPAAYVLVLERPARAPA